MDEESDDESCNKLIIDERDEEIEENSTDLYYGE